MALKEDLFTVFYQPIVDSRPVVSSVSMEALVRLVKHPWLKVCQPRNLSPLAEETGQINADIGEVGAALTPVKETKRWVESQAFSTGRVGSQHLCPPFWTASTWMKRIIAVLQRVGLSILQFRMWDHWGTVNAEILKVRCAWCNVCVSEAFT